MQPTNQRQSESKKRQILPEYEDEDFQPTIQQSAFSKRPKLDAPVVQNIEEEKEEYDLCSESEEDSNMSPQLLSDLIEATTPRPSDSQLETKRNFEELEYFNSLFRVELYQRKKDDSAVMELKLSPPMDNHGYPNLASF